jgi:opioid growth factor receptor-like protein
MGNEQLLRFYGGKGVDSRGRTIEEIWRFSPDDLEHVHDYIQWLFPLAEPSAFNPDAPLLDEQTIARFRSEPLLREHLARSLDVMLAFYRGTEDWLTPHNHNFLRLTRILKSLTLLGLEDRARELLAFLEQMYREHSRIIGATTLSYWRAAVGQQSDPLWPSSRS